MRLKEIEERLAAIKNELTTRAAELKEEEITALENEVSMRNSVYRRRQETQFLKCCKRL